MKIFRILILGKSNVGKSSLINYLKENHTALVSNKLHSSRIAISHIFHYKNTNIELVDTPGASIEDTNLLSQAMKSHATKYIVECDLVILLTQPQRNYHYEMKILQQIYECDSKYLLCVNKVDLDLQESFKERLFNELEVDDYVPISIKNSTGIDTLLFSIEKYLNNENELKKYSKNSSNEKNIIQELIRESLLNRTNKEVPYESAVCIRQIKINNNISSIKADIIVSKHNHKKIIIGKNGDMIKKIGIISREKLESYLNKKIHLSLFVVVKNNWKNNPDVLKELGYID
tara:strand:+ start:5583 stop:6449 length:867 start_codon:yes stop_codon:yes gene_type:complete